MAASPARSTPSGPGGMPLTTGTASRLHVTPAAVMASSSGRLADNDASRRITRSAVRIPQARQCSPSAREAAS